MLHANDLPIHVDLILYFFYRLICMLSPVPPPPPPSCNILVIPRLPSGCFFLVLFFLFLSYVVVRLQGVDRGPWEQFMAEILLGDGYFGVLVSGGGSSTVGLVPLAIAPVNIR